jgi:hypothetical protein
VSKIGILNLQGCKKNFYELLDDKKEIKISKTTDDEKIILSKKKAIKNI